MHYNVTFKCVLTPLIQIYWVVQYFAINTSLITSYPLQILYTHTQGLDKQSYGSRYALKGKVWRQSDDLCWERPKVAQFGSFITRDSAMWPWLVMNDLYLICRGMDFVMWTWPDTSSKAWKRWRRWNLVNVGRMYNTIRQLPATSKFYTLSKVSSLVENNRKTGWPRSLRKHSSCCVCVQYSAIHRHMNLERPLGWIHL